MQVADQQITISGKILRIAQPKYAWFEHIENPEFLLRELASTKIGADIFTFWQTLPDIKPLYEYFFEWDNVAAIPITSYEHWLNKQVVQNARNKIRKSLKMGVVVREVPFDDKFCRSVTKIYNETPIRRGRQYDHYGKSMETIKEGLSDQLESSVFLGAFHGGELIGYIKLIRLKNFLRATGTLTSTLHRDKPAMNALIAKSVEYCAFHNYPFLAYGKFTYGNKGDDSLSDFKRYNGFERFDVPHYYIPITTKGKFAMQLRLHRDLTDIVPPLLYNSFLNLRRLWNAKSHKMRSSKSQGEI